MRSYSNHKIVSAKSNPRQPRQAYSRRGWSKGENTSRTGETGKRMEGISTLESSANQEGICTQIKWQTSTARHSDYKKSGRTGNSQKRTLIQVGKPDSRQTATALDPEEDVTMP